MRGVGEPGGLAGGSVTPESAERSENALDALLDELQTFARPPEGDGEASEGEGEMVLLRRLRGPVSPEPSPAPGPRAAAAAKPPVPERNPELLQLAARRAPPPPPPRTSSRSPLASPAATYPVSPSNSSSCDSVDSQEGASRARAAVPRHDLLELRHQELLKKQKALQEQYARLQQIQRGGNSLTVVPPPDLKKTGSESNLVSRMGLNMSPAVPMSGSLTHLAGPRPQEAEAIDGDLPPPGTTTSKIYETDIL